MSAAWIYEAKVRIKIQECKQTENRHDNLHSNGLRSTRDPSPLQIIISTPRTLTYTCVLGESWKSPESYAIIYIYLCSNKELSPLPRNRSPLHSAPMKENEHLPYFFGSQVFQCDSCLGQLDSFFFLLDILLDTTY